MANNKKWVWLGLVCLLGGSLPALQAAPQQIEEQVAQPGSLQIPYQVYRLENGLTLILMPDHSDPLVHVNVTYHVGAAREQQGMTGFAHFFEHMMFQGSQHVADQQHLRLIQEVGGRANGATGTDLTTYYETVPANELEKVLWLESDRMGFLLPAVSQKKFEIQRATVKNERAQRIDNVPYGRISEVTGESLYPRDHPYSWEVIGYPEDLDRVDVNDLKRFFQQWYGPNNATLTIGGDIDTAQTLAWVERYFAAIPAGPAVPAVAPRPAILNADRYVTLPDRIQQPVLAVTIPTRVRPNTEEHAAMVLLGQVLGGSKTSLFYRELVKPELAVQADAAFSCRELDCSMTLTLVPNTSKLKSMAPLAAKVRELLAGFASQGVQLPDLARVQGLVKARMVWRLESVQGKVSELSRGQVLYGDPQAGLRMLERLQTTTAEQVMAAFHAHMAGKPALWLSVVPEGATQWQVAAPNYQPAARQITAVSHASATTPADIKETLDRTQVPPAGKPVSLPVPTVWQQPLGAMQLLGSVNSELPAVSVVITLPGGQRMESRPQAGLANLTALVVRQGTRRLTGEQLSDELQRLGATIRLSADLYETSVVVTSLKETLPQVMTLVQEVLSDPGWREADFIRLKNQLVQAAKQRAKEPDALANQAFAQLVYGKDSPLAAPEEGREATLQGLKLADVQRYYRDYYRPAGGHVVVVGDVTAERITPLLHFLANDSRPALALPSLQPSQPQAAPGIYLVDVPGAVQSTLRIGRRALPYDATGPFFQAQLMNFNFGGNFNSRLNQQLREEQGYTYGIRSSFSGIRDTGDLQISADVRQDVTAEALQQIGQLAQTYRQDGPSAAEVDYLKSAWSRQEALGYETLDQKADFLLSLVEMGYSPDYIRQQQQQLAAATPDALRSVAQQWLDPATFIMVVVGDAAHLQPKLATLPWPLHPYPVALSAASAAVSDQPLVKD